MNNFEWKPTGKLRYVAMSINQFPGKLQQEYICTNPMAYWDDVKKEWTPASKWEDVPTVFSIPLGAM